MKIKFTAKSIPYLKPVSRSIEYFDKGRAKGAGALGIRVSPKGKKTWFLMYTIGPKVKRYTMGTYPEMTLKGARDAAINTMAGINEGNDPQQKKVDYKASETFANLWAEYVISPWYLKKAETSRIEEQRKYDKLLKKTIGHKKVSDIRKKHLSPVMTDLAKTAPVNSNRLFALLNLVFRFALDRDLIEQHPMYGMRKPGGKEQPRGRYLKADEIKLLWSSFDTISSTSRDVFRLILLTAQRPGEVMSMECGEINIDEKIWTIPARKTKTKVEHIVPLSKQALDIIEPLLDGHSSFLFPSNGKAGHVTNTSKSRYKLWEQVDVKKWGAHDLRRSSRTLMSKIGVKPAIAERILNHSRGKMESTYDHYGFLPEKRIALDELGSEIARIVKDNKPGKLDNMVKMWKAG